MPGISFVVALSLTLLGAEPLWPDLAKLPAATGGGERDAAVVVAVEEYADLPKVEGAAELGAAWFRYLTEVRKVPTVLLLTNRDGTPGKMRNAIETAVDLVQPGGRVWFVFIGHGSPSQDGKDGVLVGALAQADQIDFFNNTIGRQQVVDALVKDSKTQLPPVVIIDACFSGTDSSGQALIAGSQFAVSQELATLPNATILTAGRSKDIAGPLPGARRPAFSYLLLGALRGWGDLDQDGVVTTQEAIRYVVGALATVDPGRQQRPQHSGDDVALVAMPRNAKGEAAPDLAAIRLRLTGTGNSVGAGAGDGGGGGGTVGADLAAELAALEKARQARERAEKAEREARDAARKKHEAEVEVSWAAVLRVAQGGGQEGAKAVKLFLDRYKGHPLGNPKEAEARKILERLANDVGAASNGYILVNGGCFQMGSPSGDLLREPDEGQHEVCLSNSYYMKETEVTQAEWSALMGTNPSRFSGCGADCPVENVSWWDAVSYANALSAKEGLEACYALDGCTGTAGRDLVCAGVEFQGLSCEGFRLPTEAEWEYAARAGTATSTYAGELVLQGDRNEPSLDLIGWYGGNSGVTYAGGMDCSEWKERQYSADRCGTQPVRSKKPNAWGFYDMLGSVWEWCGDWYAGFGPEVEVTDPTGPETGQRRSIRGGSWDNPARYVRSANRSGNTPGFHDSGLGFRLCRTKR